MQRLPQFILILSFVLFSWLAFMVVHEFGHALTAWSTGGSVKWMILHPLQISWTTFSRNPHPQLVTWGGPVLGALLPCLFWIIARWLRTPGIYLFRFFAGFCLIAIGLYLIVDSFGRGGDAGALMRMGTPQWQLLLFGLVTTPTGFWMWHGLGPHFGLGVARGRVRLGALTASLVLLATTVALELALY
jgi:hypothetical protein